MLLDAPIISYEKFDIFITVHSPSNVVVPPSQRKPSVTPLTPHEVDAKHRPTSAYTKICLMPNAQRPNHRTSSSSYRHPDSVALKHTVNEIAQGSPVIPTTCQTVLVDEQDVLLKAGVEMGFKAELTNHRVVVAVNVRVDTIHALENLANQRRE
jgi:hypothetical protein